MKKLWRRTEGFTLVELVVVIAILGILAGVGTVGYSGYIKKANMAADEALIRDVKYALTLAGYDGAFGNHEAGYFVLSADNEVQGVAEGSALEKALITTFGTNYKDVLKLSYDKWSNSGIFGSDVDVMGAVKYSSYMSGNRKDVLLTDVEKMTKMAKDFASVFGGGSGLTFSDLFGADKLYATASQYGIGKEEWDVDDWDDWGEENSTAYANLLVLTAADEAENSLYNGAELSTASTLILNFSAYYGYAAIDPEFSEVFDEHMANLSSVHDDASGKAWFDALADAADESDGYDDYMSSQSELDKSAFQGIISALGTPTEEQAANIAGDLNNEKLFSSGVVNGMYNDYLNAVDAVCSMAENELDISGFGDLAEGEVMVLYVSDGSGLRISDSLPSA